MTRIIAGTAKGRSLKVPTSGTRPTSDRVRESIFNSLGHRLGSWSGLAVLDLYAGSGAFALEAMSRGAEAAIAVEKDARAAAVIRTNAETLNFPVRVVTSDVTAAIARLEGSFDVVFIDPPYELSNDVLSEVLVNLCDRGLIAEGSVLVVERSARTDVLAIPEVLTLADDRNIGETRVYTLVW